MVSSNAFFWDDEGGPPLPLMDAARCDPLPQALIWMYVERSGQIRTQAILAEAAPDADNLPASQQIAH